METRRWSLLRWLMMKFLPYLWGMETVIEGKNSVYRIFSFLPYLWGMETFYVVKVLTKFQGSYRTYEEWKLGFKSTTKTRAKRVLTVPMRNGNLVGRLFQVIVVPQFLPYLWGMETIAALVILNKIIGSYRTYEEWKPTTIKKKLMNDRVLTVPMRNGNSASFLSSRNNSW